MKSILLFTILIFIKFGMYGQQETYKTLDWDGRTREYLEYVPQIYFDNPSEPVPLVLCLHGLGNTMESFRDRIHMYNVADTANFIVLTPEAIINSLTGKTCWNAGVTVYGIGNGLNYDIDDTGFLDSLLKKTISLYNIDLSRIYVTGYSMGGYMTNKLACQLNDKIAAIASVSGTIGNDFNPYSYTLNPIPTLHMHGTDDETVPYSGNSSQGWDAEDLVNFWVGINNCNTQADTILYDDVADTSDNGDYRSILEITYSGGNKCTETVFYKIIHGDHGWPYSPADDIDGTTKIWQFFSRHKKWETTTLNETACNFYTSPSNNIYTQSGIYNDTLQTNCGLDSIITINLTINTIDNSVTVNNNTITANENNANYQWINCFDNSIIQGEISQNFTATETGSYAVIINNGLCIDTSDCNQIVITTNINENNKCSFKIFPNPTENYLQIKYDNNYLVKTIQILDVTGKIVKQTSITNKEKKQYINISSLKSGIYFIKINNYIQKIIKY